MSGPASPGWLISSKHMMFKGTLTLGTKDIDKGLGGPSRSSTPSKTKLWKEEEALIERHRRGLIEDPKDAKNRSENHKQLLKEFGETASTAARVDREGRV